MPTDRNPPPATRHRLGEWMAREEAHMAAFRERIAAEARAHAGDRLRTPAVQALARLFDDRAVLRMGLTRAIDEALDAGLRLGYASIGDLMTVLDHLMTYTPPFSEASLIVCPINAFLDWPMCMPSGHAVFRDATVNAHLKCVLNVWCDFLGGPHSRTHLDTSAPDGWFCDAARKRLGLSQFQYRDDQPHLGFDSWNDFFTRRFRDGARPVEAPDDPHVIVSACEAAPYHTESKLKLRDTFWIKAQPYSLRDLFTPAWLPLAERFVGGDIYQAYLSAYNYHRWHAPVRGVVTHAYRVDGTYYSVAEAEGTDPAGLNDSQGYMTAVATRAVVALSCDDPGIGTVAAVFVGMGDVSSCVIDVVPGQRVDKGDEIGYFQFGGSTYCLLFEAGVIDRFLPAPPFDSRTPVVQVNAGVAIAR
ncbi:phosphatidylserine decarboxylase family protein [Burkholderia cepacia]|uniref:phosphatidylserine decarboxylase family protein n=1 Tax=Burkholderia cepacia TaxID=292 RepID=UPI0007543C1C|nr:phosphatidylserine decarboxylase family protein [Burkholderia cepacia]KVS61337.1 phosphatidylserine decarboxylase [Burkholderia cepacia]RQT81027.1 phosphatidylserine decarboxylase family protein [Burkholderia cepacia]RQT99769.1 phosphatidylserine decarboxylase family protein [Burkholderia cepacia]RQZ81676.1 phosphatidylserine decarboxylase family protein [Burkholderia cepacia]